jgi:hypothetical protein
MLRHDVSATDSAIRIDLEHLLEQDENMKNIVIRIESLEKAGTACS